MSSRRKWLCLDCSTDTGKIYEHFYVNLDLWLSVVGSKIGMLCIGCLESRLGRKLVAGDFPKVTINDPKHSKMSQRLLSRIRGQAHEKQGSPTEKPVHGHVG